MKKRGMLTMLIALLGVLTTSCDKEKMEMRRTFYFTTAVDPSEGELTLYVEDIKVGVVPYFIGGIQDPADRDEGLKYKLEKKENQVSVKNSAGEEVAKGMITSGKYRTSTEVESEKGTLSPTTVDLEGFSGTFIYIQL